MSTDKIISTSLIIIVVFLSGVVFHLAKPFLFPFVLAVFLSFLLFPVVDFMTGMRIPKSVAIILILIVTLSILYLFGGLLYSSGKSFAQELPNYGEKITSILNGLQEKLRLTETGWTTIDWENQLDLGKLSGLLFSTVGTFFNFISKLFLILIFLIFILAGRGKIKTKVKEYFSKEQAVRISSIIENIDKQVQKYLFIKTIVSLITGAVATIVLLLFDVDFAIFFGFMTFVFNYIPNIGSIIATLLPVAVAVIQFESLWPALLIFFILLVIQQTLGAVIEPRLMGKGLGLSPLVVLFFLFLWGWLWGISGMILAVPIAAVIKIICGNIPELHFIAILMSEGKNRSTFRE